MLQPKRTKFRKQFKGRIHGQAKGGSDINFGTYALKTTEPERITARQIEAARRAMTRHGRRLDAVGDLVLTFATAREGDPRTPELLHRFVRLTRRASIHRSTDERTGVLSRRAYDLLHERHPDSPWTADTPYWYR